MKKYNFNPGPAILPAQVFKQASQAVLELPGAGLSVLEISHRSKEFEGIMQEAKSLVKELYALPDGYEVLFLQGGASSQFFMAAMNLLGPGQKAGYIDTGNWSDKAIAEAKMIGSIDVLASSKDRKYSYIPKKVDVDPGLSYLHITSNNTIRGTQYHEYPDAPVKLVADMSSDILSKPIPIERFGVIYAGAQKNLGPAGTTLVVVDKSFVETDISGIPTMLKYSTHIAKNSMFNTPPVFAIYVSLLTLRWLAEQGGLARIEQKNSLKAKTLYQAIDESKLFCGTADADDRSHMNITFLLRDESLSGAFHEACTQAACVGVKGHRSAGGFRASVYNAMSLEGVERLSEVIRQFDKSHA